MIHREIREWDYLPIAPHEHAGGLSRAQADSLLAAARAIESGGSEGERILIDGGRRLRAQQTVGILVADGVTLEILPKIDADTATARRSLVHMLAATYDLDIEVGAPAALGWQSETLLEVLIRLFCDKLFAVLRRGLPRAYLVHADDLRALRGRLDTVRQFTVLTASPQRLACQFEELSPDTPLNRIIKAAVRQLASWAQAPENRRRLNELAFAYADVTEVPPSALPWDRVILDRTNVRWRELLDFARLLLGCRFQTTSTGGIRGFALLFEMNTLFEAFVGRAAARALAGSGVAITLQGPRRHALTDLERHHRLFATRPDIVVSRAGHPVLVLDTKWKRLTNAIEDRRGGVGQADVYQMMAYAHVYECDRLGLVFPHHAGLQQPSGMISCHSIVNRPGSRLGILTLDLRRPETVASQLRGALVDWLHASEVPGTSTFSEDGLLPA